MPEHFYNYEEPVAQDKVSAFLNFISLATNIIILKNSYYGWQHCIMYIYSLAPGVSFDLLQRLYKLEHPTSLCCRASDICTVGQI